MVTQMSMAVIALAVVVLVIYLIRTLRTLDVTLKYVNEAVAKIESDLHGISERSVSILEETKTLTSDLNQKSQKLDSLFSSAKGMGESVEQVSASMVTQAEQYRVQLGNVLAITSFGLELWQQWKDSRKRDTYKEEN